MKRFASIFFSALAVVMAAAVALRPRRNGATSSAGAAPAAPRPRRRAVGAPAPPAAAQLTAAAPEGPGLEIESLDDASSALRALLTRIKRHNTIMIAAGLSYYSLLAMFPAAIAAVSIFGLAADPADLERQLAELTSALPDETADFVEEQLQLIVNSSGGTLGLATGLSILVALWSASAGTKALITAINHAYGERETRSFLVLRGSALAVTIGMITFGLAATTVVGFLPQILSGIGLEDETAAAINVLRWPVVFVVVVLGLGALFKLAPNRPWRMTRWINFGAIIAAVLWVLATVGMSVYVNSFATFNETYGTLAGLIVLMLWFFVSGFVILLGAEINSYLERHGAYAAR